MGIITTGIKNGVNRKINEVTSLNIQTKRIGRRGQRDIQKLKYFRSILKNPHMCAINTTAIPIIEITRDLYLASEITHPAPYRPKIIFNLRMTSISVELREIKVCSRVIPNRAGEIGQLHESCCIKGGMHAIKPAVHTLDAGKFRTTISYYFPRSIT